MTRTDLSDTRLLPGTLDFGAGVKVRGSGDGIVTRLPAVGATVRRGQPLFRVDDQPVAVLFGDTPLFRPLDKPGLTGRDVAELRDNLALLGYASMRVRDRDVLDAGLLAAARRWQHDLDLPSPSVVTPARAVVLDGPGRVSAVTGRLGDPVATDLLTVTGMAKVVSVPVDPHDGSGLSVLAARSDLLAAIGGRMASGGFLGPATARFPTAALGHEAAARLGFDRVPSAQVGVRIGNRWFTVIGIMAPAPLAPDLDQSVLVGWDAAGSMLGFDGHPTVLYVRADEDAPDDVRAVLPATVNPALPGLVQISRPSDAGVAGAIAAGVLAGVYPAIRAARLTPTEALATSG